MDSVIVGLIVLVVAAFVVRRFYLTLKGERTCCDGGCSMGGACSTSLAPSEAAGSGCCASGATAGNERDQAAEGSAEQNCQGGDS
jgi:hypothetical protein